MITKKRTAIKNKLEAMGLNVEIAQMFIDALEHCDSASIHPLDLKLTEDVYPVLARKYKLKASTIEKKMMAALKECWSTLERRKAVVKALKYESKPTTKIVLQLLMMK